MNRFLGVDYGTRRIGLAISDGLGLTARPLDVVSRDDLDTALRSIAAEYPLERVIIGLPTALAGHEGESARGARDLGEHITALLEIEVEFVDERFTSHMAEDALLEAGMKRQDRRSTVDKVAAAIILQTYLDSRHPHGNPDPGEGVEIPGSP